MSGRNANRLCYSIGWFWAAVSMLTAALIGLSGCGAGKPVTPATSSAPALPLAHVKLCHYWELRAKDSAQSKGSRDSAQHYYDQRCQDVAASEAGQ